jgi:Ser/Thr protein kinase RdoA (MazF antagonist)
MSRDDVLLEVSSRPAVDGARAAELATEVYGVDGPVRELGSHQDRNYRVDGPEGRLVLKVANRSWGRPAVEAQNAALLHIASRDTTFHAPVPVAGVDGALLHEVADGDDLLPLRLLTYVESGSPST